MEPFILYLINCKKKPQKLLYLETFINTLRLGQNGRRFPDDISKYIFLNENVWISNKISLKFVPKGQIHNVPALVQTMAWRRQAIVWTNDG